VSPHISYGNKVIQPDRADWNMNQTSFKTAPALSSWTWLALDAGGLSRVWNNPNALSVTLNAWTKELSNVGIRVDSRPSVAGQRIDIGRDDWEIVIQRTIESLSKVKLSFVLVILPHRDTAIYNAVKLNCDVRYGVRHACVIADKFATKGVQYYANTTLKVNLKLGGTNHVLENNQLGIIDGGKTMVVGIDVTHPSPGSATTAPSIAGIVASINKNLGQFPAELRIQAAKQEKVDALDLLLKSRLQLWHKHNKEYPQNIIVYRDGVSEGQYEMVVNEELPQLKKACKDLYPATEQKKGFPRISIVVVGKRHHTRFYPTSEKDAEGRSNNPPNGTVVDRGVTEARTFDFFLQAHRAMLGTARPGHYITVYDEIFRREKPKQPLMNAADILQDLSHRLCYTFGRATKAVSICPPAYYADLVCERARCYLSDSFDPTSTTASVSESTDSQQRTVTQAMVTIHANVKDTMFYI
jgi:eukaryotic translation initiation factor 2C